MNDSSDGSSSFKWSPGFTPANIRISFVGKPAATSNGSTAVTKPPAFMTWLALPVASVCLVATSPESAFWK